MCGIAGVLDAPKASGEYRTLVAAMTTTLAHRGPDDEGLWDDAAVGVCLGHRRLAVLDLSQHGHQPMVSACGRFVLSYNGEVYNHLDLRSELERNATRFRGHSDTETIAEAMSAWGIRKTLDALDGMFALAVWDRQENRLTLARDPFGEKPLYFGWAGNAFLFASELHAFAQHAEFERTVDPHALAAYLRYGCVPAPLAIWKRTRKLPPGCFVEVTANSSRAALEPQPYWNAEDAAAEAIEARARTPATLEDVEERLKQRVAKSLLSDVPLGVFLSGGIDSSLIAALAQEASDTPIRTFTIGFEEDGYDEAAYARQVAAHLGTEHHEVRLAPQQAMAVIEQLAQMYSEPFADSSQLPTHLVSKIAREHVTVALSGDGGDELFGGYDRYRLGARAWNTLRRAPLGVRRGLAGALGKHTGRSQAAKGSPRALGVDPASWTQKLQKLSRAAAATNEAEYFDRITTIWQTPPVQGDPSVADTTALWSKVGAGITDLRERWMLRDTLGYLSDDILAKVDRAAMAVSLETRAPFLGKDIFDVAWRLPIGLRVTRKQGKLALRELLAKRIPRDAFERPKKGFGVPIAQWLRGPLKEWAENLLDRERIRSQGLLDADLVYAAWEEHLAGQDRHAELWCILMFQEWYANHGPGLADETPAPVPVAAHAR